MSKLDKQYTDLLQDILDNGVQKGDRTGTGTISVFGRQIRHKMSDGFPLLTTKKMPFKTIVTELLWFLRGDTNIKYLVDNDCNIWTGDAFKNYLNTYKGNFELDKEEFINAIKTSPDFAKQWGELGPIYGKQWRSWPTYSVGETTFKTGIYTAWRNEADQIANLINDLKTNPDSRRLMVSAWNVGELDQMVLPPCHFSWQCYSHEKDGKRYLSLAWNQRSVDCGLGLPFNIASYGLLLEIIAKKVNMIPYELIGNLGDCHIYNNHIEGIKEQLNREPFELPTLKLNPIFLTNLEHKGLDEAINGQVNFELENYQFHSIIKLPLSN
jgi:thymidylate synthase